MLAITFVRTDVRADAQTTQTELTAQFTAFVKLAFRADAQTTIELTANLTTFMRLDVRTDARTTIELTAQLVEPFDVLLFAPTPPGFGPFAWRVGADKMTSLWGSARSCSQSHSCGLTFVLVHNQFKLN